MAENNQTLPPQHQEQRPGKESAMHPCPQYKAEEYKAAGKLEGKVAVITGANSGIGRAVAVVFAREGADIVLLYLDQSEDAEETRREIEKHGRRCLTLAGDVADAAFCRMVVEETLGQCGHLDVLVNNAGEQHPQERLEDISEEQWEKTFRTNIFGMFHLTKAALPSMKAGGSIINTTSVTAYKGNPKLIDYSSTRGDHCLHPLPVGQPGAARHPCQRGGAGADLDAIDPLHLQRGGGGTFRRLYAAEASGTAGGGSAGLRVSRL
ncbi:short chain dehydrogenase [Azotobacter beijerinckii]|uniref:Short chain dehydrogenase n=1 Tax=Azotobacter beijerinckii TaxID=170623 RepID=A0A1H7AP88_9GAMM|nr:short chain dehydrogenase [Azotobacter beijerinckii]